MKITLVAYTKFLQEAAEHTTGYRWDGGDYDDDNDAGKLAVFAGRGCYESWEAPNPATATIEGYLDNIFKQEHFSVIEHGSVSLHFAGVSRSFTHELIRHRHFSFSQLSQRYAPLGDETKAVIPPLLSSEEGAQVIIFRAWKTALEHYHDLLKWSQVAAHAAGYTGSMARKRAQEAARCVLPNMTPTKILVTGNHRSLMEFLLKRGGIAADLEIREAAFEVHRQLSMLEPALYANIVIVGEDAERRLAMRP